MIRIGLIIVFLSASLFAQSGIESELRSNRSQLNKLKSEISTLRTKIKRNSIKSSSTLEQIKDIDRNIALTGKVKKLLTRESQLLSKRLNTTRRDLKQTRATLKALRDQFAKQSIRTYKYGKIQNLTLLLQSTSLNQALVRYKYLKLFSEQQAKLIHKIQRKSEQIKVLSQSLKNDLQQQQAALKEKEREEQTFLAMKDEKRVLLDRLHWSEQSMRTQLKNYQQQYEKLTKLIAALEEKRRQREKSPERAKEFEVKFKNFGKAKGKLPWPVTGKVITRYGKRRNKILKTYINNPGIDIKAKSGTRVRSVFTGLVSMITYLSGYGNTVIVDHGKGYYSVYSHLDEVRVNPDQVLEAGDVIGLVGDSGSLNGAKLHFEIYAGQKTVNPQSWLK